MHGLIRLRVNRSGSDSFCNSRGKVEIKWRRFQSGKKGWRQAGLEGIEHQDVGMRITGDVQGRCGGVVWYCPGGPPAPCIGKQVLQLTEAEVLELMQADRMFAKV